MKHSDFSSGRIIGISDGVFAIAMTLLVLELKLPDLDPSSDPGVFAAALKERIPGFISWILSFAILCRLWIMHHGLMRIGNTRSWRFLAWNLVFLAAVSFIPFPTSLLSEHHDRVLSVVVFSGTYLVASLALGRMAVAYRRQTRSAEAATVESSVARLVAILVAVALSSCLLALVHPWLGVLIWVFFRLRARSVAAQGIPRPHKPEMGADFMTSPTNDRRTQLQLQRDKIHRQGDVMPSTALCVDRADPAVS